MSIPVTSPDASLEISPPHGLGVVLSMLATRNAALLAMEAWPSARTRITGLSGATLSRSARVGNTGGFQKVSIQPRPLTHSPLFFLATSVFTAERNASRLEIPS